MSDQQTLVFEIDDEAVSAVVQRLNYTRMPETGDGAISTEGVVREVLEAYADAMHLKAHQERPEERRGRESNSQTLKGPRG